jgi:hypothetical protein
VPSRSGVDSVSIGEMQVPKSLDPIDQVRLLVE